MHSTYDIETDTHILRAYVITYNTSEVIINSTY